MTAAKAKKAKPVQPQRGEGAKRVYDQLKAEILSLALQPGQHLDENQLARRFKLSRSPVREAIIRLAGEGLLATLSNRSTQVAPLDLAGFPKYIEALDLLQRANTRLAAKYRTDADIASISASKLEFEKAVRSSNYLAMAETNKAFHVAIAKAGNNPYLAREYDRLLSEGLRMLHLHFDDIASSKNQLLQDDEHGHMLQAIIAQDLELADQLAHAHTCRFRDRFLQFLQHNGTAALRLAPTVG
jgi:DNA-binding GntR family transcriptional regulator